MKTDKPILLAASESFADEKPQHTPGPWTLYGDVHIAKNGELLAEVLRGGKRQLPIQSNARLIAAAPELLEALKECVTEEGAIAERSHAFALKRLAYITEVSRAAIARAEGRIA